MYQFFNDLREMSLQYPISFSIYFFLMGSCIGSLLNFLIYRLKTSAGVLTLRSGCDYCHTPIPIWYNVPVAGYLILRGKTACCSKRLDKSHLYLEVVNGMLYGVPVLIWGLSNNVLLYFCISTIVSILISWVFFQPQKK